MYIIGQFQSISWFLEQIEHFNGRVFIFKYTYLSRVCKKDVNIENKTRKLLNDRLCCLLIQIRDFFSTQPHQYANISPLQHHWMYFLSTLLWCLSRCYIIHQTRFCATMSSHCLISMMIYKYFNPDANDKNNGLMICWAPEKDNYKHHPLGFINLLFIFLGIYVFICLFILSSCRMLRHFYIAVFRNLNYCWHRQ